MDLSLRRLRLALLGGSVRRKLLVGFALVSVLTVLVGAVGVYSVSEVASTTGEIVSEDAQQVDGVMILKEEAQTERASIYAFLRGRDGARSEFRAARQKWDGIYQSRFANTEALSAEQKRLLRRAKEKHEQAVSAAKAVIEAKSRGDAAAVEANLRDFERFQKGLAAILGNLATVTRNQMAADVAAAEQLERTAELVISVLTAVSLIVGGVIAWRVGGGIGMEVRRLSDVSGRIAEGDFDFSFETSDRSDEIGNLSRSFARMTAFLQTISRQAEAVADQEFDDDSLDEQAPGQLGRVMMEMAEDIESTQRDLQSLNDSLEQTATDYRATMERAADGDLTQRMDATSENEAMVAIGETFNEMMDDFEATVATIREFTDEVGASSDTVQSGTEEIGSASEEVTTSVQQIARNADEQSENLTQVNQELQSLSGSIEEIASSADGVAETAQQATDRSQSGREAAGTAIDEMEEIEATADETVTEVESLAAEVEEIGEIVDLINDVAEQTNMLALNASIEAARAGEAGEGFAVVADEIKGLATKVSEATDDIETLIDDVQHSTDEAVGDMRLLGERVTNGADTIEGALADFDEVVDVIEDVNSGIQEISNATGDQAASTEEAVSMVEQVTEASEQASVEAEQASAATEEQAASLQEIGEQMGGLVERTTELDRYLAEFEVDDGTSAAGGVTTDGVSGITHSGTSENPVDE